MKTTSFKYDLIELDIIREVNNYNRLHREKQI